MGLRTPIFHLKCLKGNYFPNPQIEKYLHAIFHAQIGTSMQKFPNDFLSCSSHRDVIENKWFFYEHKRNNNGVLYMVDGDALQQ